MSRSPLVSVIIPTYNNQRIVNVLLSSIKKQTYKKIETIVVDDGSKDRTITIVKKYTKKVFARKHAERSIQRNFGAGKSRGEFLLFLDSDMELSKNVISDCVQLMNKDIHIGGIVIPEESIAKSYWEKVKAFERSFYNKDGDSTTEAARFIRRDAFKKVGGYDERITGPEDWDLPESIKKYGYNINRIESKIFHHERIPNLFSLASKKYYYGLKSHNYLKKHDISLIGPKTIYFFRPVFYKNWKKLILNPVLSVSMFVMFLVELSAGAIGFFMGKYVFGNNNT